MNLALWLQRHARTDPARTAIFVGAAPWKSYARLAADAACLARGLREKLGLVPGDRVALVMANSPQYAEAMLAVWWAGLAAVPVNAKLHPREVAFILENAGASAVFATPDWIAGLAEASTQARADAGRDRGGQRRLRLALHGADAGGRGRRRRARLALLHQRHHGAPQGRDALARATCAPMAQGYLTDVDAVTAGDCLLHAAPMSHGSGLYISCRTCSPARRR